MGSGGEITPVARMPDMFLILEDNAERVQRFTAVLRGIERSVGLRCWRDAWRMIGEVSPLLPKARIISLDHDLDPEEGSVTDPGTGLDVARYLATLSPRCPVIIHTSNSDGATRMMGEFELGGWECHRILPLGEDWIELDWHRLAQRLLEQNGA